MLKIIFLRCSSELISRDRMEWYKFFFLEAATEWILLSQTNKCFTK